MLLLAYAFSGTNYAALKAHPYGTTKDVFQAVEVSYC